MPAAVPCVRVTYRRVGPTLTSVIFADSLTALGLIQLYTTQMYGKGTLNAHMSMSDIAERRRFVLSLFVATNLVMKDKLNVRQHGRILDGCGHLVCLPVCNLHHYISKNFACNLSGCYWAFQNPPDRVFGRRSTTIACFKAATAPIFSRT